MSEPKYGEPTESFHQVDQVSYVNPMAIQPGDVVRHVQSCQERVVVSVRLDMGLIQFSDSDMVGWSQLDGWIPTGVKAAK